MKAKRGGNSIYLRAGKRSMDPLTVEEASIAELQCAYHSRLWPYPTCKLAKRANVAPSRQPLRSLIPMLAYFL